MIALIIVLAFFSITMLVLAFVGAAGEALDRTDIGQRIGAAFDRAFGIES